MGAFHSTCFRNMRQIDHFMGSFSCFFFNYRWQLPFVSAQLFPSGYRIFRTTCSHLSVERQRFFLGAPAKREPLYFKWGELKHRICFQKTEFKANIFLRSCNLRRKQCKNKKLNNNTSRSRSFHDIFLNKTKRSWRMWTQDQVSTNWIMATADTITKQHYQHGIFTPSGDLFVNKPTYMVSVSVLPSIMFHLFFPFFSVYELFKILWWSKKN